MNVGHLGSLRSAPAPSAAVLNEAIKLLTTFGDSKSLKPILEQMREVLTHNERAIAQFDGLALRESDVLRREREASEAEARVDVKLAAIARIRGELD